MREARWLRHSSGTLQRGRTSATSKLTGRHGVPRISVGIANAQRFVRVEPIVEPIDEPAVVVLSSQRVGEPASDNPSLADESDGVQLRFDSAETFSRRDSGLTSRVTKIDRHQAVVTLEAETYRGVVQRLTSLMGQLDLLVLSTSRLERRLSAASELQPLLSRAISESKQIAESVCEMHSLHRSYLPKLQWCNVETMLNRCCAALKREASDSDVKLMLSNEPDNYRIHVDAAAFGRAFFWLVRNAMINLSSDDRVIRLSSEYIDDELRLRAVYRHRPIVIDSRRPTAGVLQVEDQFGLPTANRNATAQSPLNARWTIEDHPDAYAVFDIFIRCPRTEL